MRLSKQQKKILIYMKECNRDVSLYNVKSELWGTITAGHSDGDIFREYNILRDQGGNKHYSVKRSVLNLVDKKLITVKMEQKFWKTSPKMHFSLTEEGSKCVENLLHNKSK